MALPLPQGAVGASTSKKEIKKEEEGVSRISDIPENLFETSDEVIEYPNIPQATDIEDVGFFESLLPNVKGMFARDDFSKAEIIKNSFAGDERFGGVFVDKFNNPMILWNDMPYYVNKPGAGLPDIGTFTGEILKYLPASKFVAGAKGLGETVKRGLSVYPATELAGKAVESAMAPETAKAKEPTAGKLIEETGVATAIGVGADIVLPGVVKAGKGAIVQAAKGAEKAGAKKVFPKFSPEKVAEKIGAKPIQQRSKYKLTEGQRTAPLPERGPTEKVTAQLEQEDILRRAPSTDEAASNLMRGFDERQLDEIRSDARALQAEMGSGDVSIRMAEDVPTAAAEKIQEIGIAGAADRKALAKQAYETVKTAELPPVMSREGILLTARNALNEITTGMGITAREMADMPLLRRELEYLKRLSKAASNERFKAQPLKVLHGYQKSLNRAVRSAQQGSPEQMALSRIKGVVDRSVFEGIEDGIMLGDETILQELKSAQDLYKQYMNLIGKGSAKDAQEKAANKILEKITNPNFTPKQVVQALFGHAKFNPTQTMKIVIDRLERNLPQYQNAEEIKALLKDGILEKAFSGTGRSGITRTNIVNNYDDVFVKNKAIIDSLFSKEELKKIKLFRDNVLPTLWSEIKLNPSGSGYTVLSGLAQKGLLNYARFIPIVGTEATETVQKMRAVSQARRATSQQVDRMNRPLFSAALQATARPPVVEAMEGEVEVPASIREISSSVSPEVRRKLIEAAATP